MAAHITSAGHMPPVLANVVAQYVGGRQPEHAAKLVGLTLRRVLMTARCFSHFAVVSHRKSAFYDDLVDAWRKMCGSLDNIFFNVPFGLERGYAEFTFIPDFHWVHAFIDTTSYDTLCNLIWHISAASNMPRAEDSDDRIRLSIANMIYEFLSIISSLNGDLAKIESDVP